MDSAKPRSLGSLATWTAGTLIGLLLLGLLSTGPIMYVAYRFPNYYVRLIEPWDGLREFIRATPLNQPVEDYWVGFGASACSGGPSLAASTTPNSPRRAGSVAWL